MGFGDWLKNAGYTLDPWWSPEEQRAKEKRQAAAAAWRPVAKRRGAKGPGALSDPFEALRSQVMAAESQRLGLGTTRKSLFGGY